VGSEGVDRNMLQSDKVPYKDVTALASFKSELMS